MGPVGQRRRNELLLKSPQELAAADAADVTMNVKGRLLMTERFEVLGTQRGRAPEAAAMLGVLSYRDFAFR